MVQPAKPNSIESAWREIEIELASARDRIFEAIRNYPPPITACDEQFDQLLAQRECVARELERVKEAAAATAADRETVARIEEFIASSKFLDEAARGRIKASIG